MLNNPANSELSLNENFSSNLSSHQLNSFNHQTKTPVSYDQRQLTHTAQGFTTDLCYWDVSQTTATKVGQSTYHKPPPITECSTNADTIPDLVTDLLRSNTTIKPTLDGWKTPFPLVLLLHIAILHWHDKTKQTLAVNFSFPNFERRLSFLLWNLRFRSSWVQGFAQPSDTERYYLKQVLDKVVK